MKMKITLQEHMRHSKVVLRGKLIALRGYIKRTEKSQINGLKLHLKLLGKQEQAKPKTSTEDRNNKNKG
jgi:hypothetical protein